MKEAFYEFYKLSPKKINEIWETGLLVVDTNVLLDLYRLSKEARKDLKSSIEHFGERIWLPYQAGLEFHRNREKVIKDLGGISYENFKTTLNNKVVPDVKNALKEFQRHPCIDYNYIEKKLESFRQDIEKKVEVWKKAYPFDVEKDDVLKWVKDRYDGKVGEDFTTKELLRIYEEGKTRYQANVPPGYKDASNNEKKEAGQRYIYGDLIIWKSVIKKAKKEKVDIIFLTNDNKEDWFEKYKGQTKGPRFELLREFHKETGRDIIIMTEAAFLKEVKEKTSVEVKESSIEDAEGATVASDFYSRLLNGSEATSPLLRYATLEDSMFPIRGAISGLSSFSDFSGAVVNPPLIKPSFQGIDADHLSSLIRYSLPSLLGNDGKEKE